MKKCSSWILCEMMDTTLVELLLFCLYHPWSRTMYLLLRHQLFLACWEQENGDITMESSLLLSLLLHVAGLLLQWAWGSMLSVPVLRMRGGQLWLKKDVSLCTEDRRITLGYILYLLALPV
jgi:hypothetical protein